MLPPLHSESDGVDAGQANTNGGLSGIEPIGSAVIDDPALWQWWISRLGA